MLRKYPLAFASLLLGITSFVHLFGLEKALLAVLLGGFALKELPAGQAGGRKLAYAGIVLGFLYIATLLAIMFIKGPGLMQLIGKYR